MELKDVVVLNLSPDPDQSGNIISSETEIYIPPIPVLVTKNFDHNQYLGNAYIRRNDHQVVGDIVLDNVAAQDVIEAIKLSGVCPAIAGTVLEREGHFIKKMNITSLGLIPAGSNVDPMIPPLKITE